MRFVSTAISAAGLPLIHLIALTLFLTGTTRADWIAFAVIYFLAMLTLGGGLHRYFAHKSFRTSRAFQFILGFMASCIFGDPIGFAAKHRWHHRYADKPDDLHSPAHGLWHCWIGQIFENRLTEEEMLRMTPDLARYQELMWLHRYWFVPGLAVSALFLAVGGYRMFACAYVLSLVAALHGTSAVNYFCHRGRRRNYETPDRSSNSAILAILMLGEGWHNNHHHDPAAARSGVAWYEIDVIYWMLKALSRAGLLWSLRQFRDSAASDRGKQAREVAAA